jgi:hypothetical protein
VKLNINAFVAVSLIFLLSFSAFSLLNISSVHAQIQGSGGLMYYPNGFDCTDSSALPNNGVQMTIEAVFQPTSEYIWIADSMSNNVFVQFGYSAAGLMPAWELINNTYDPFGLGENYAATAGSSPLWTGPKMLRDGNNYTFGIEFTSDSVLTLTLDGSPVVVLTPQYITQYMASINEVNTVTAFSHVSMPNANGDAVAVTFEDMTNNMVDVTIPVGMEVLQNNVWHLTDCAWTNHGEAVGIGMIGHNQNPALPIGEVLVSSSVVASSGFTVLWGNSSNVSPTPAPFYQNPTATPYTNPVTVKAVPLLQFSVAIIAVSIISICAIYAKYNYQSHSRKKRKR